MSRRFVVVLVLLGAAVGGWVVLHRSKPTCATQGAARFCITKQHDGALLKARITGDGLKPGSKPELRIEGPYQFAQWPVDAGLAEDSAWMVDNGGHFRPGGIAEAVFDAKHNQGGATIVARGTDKTGASVEVRLVATAAAA